MCKRVFELEVYAACKINYICIDRPVALKAQKANKLNMILIQDCIVKLTHLITTNLLTIFRILGHSGGNEKVDKLAKESINKNSLDVSPWCRKTMEN